MINHKVSVLHNWKGLGTLNRDAKTHDCSFEYAENKIYQRLLAHFHHCPIPKAVFLSLGYVIGDHTWRVTQTEMYTTREWKG